VRHADRGAAIGPFFPQITANASGSRNKVSFAGSAPIKYNAVTATGNVSWELDFWGRIRRGEQAANFDLLGREDLTDVYAELYVERPSQKAIVIGTKGARLKDVGSRARKQIEALLGTHVYLDLRVKIAKDWQRNPKQLRRLGFYD